MQKCLRLQIRKLLGAPWLSEKCLENCVSVPSAWRNWRRMISVFILVPVATRYSRPHASLTQCSISLI